MKPLMSTLAGACLAALIPNFAVAEEAPPEVTVTPIAGPLYFLQGRGGNVVASVGEDGALIIDSDYEAYAPAHQAAVAELAGGEGAPRFLLNTHWHFDHTGGNAFFGERGSVIVAHENIYQRMSTKQNIKALGRVTEPSPKPALPVVTYGDAIAMHFNGDTIEVQHYPTSHTDGDSIMFFAAENVVHMGDTFFYDRFPFVDISSGGNAFGLIKTIETVLARIDDKTVVVPGHGPLTDKAGLARYHNMLVTTTGQITAMLDDGMSVTDIAAKGLGDEWDSWGSGFIDEGRFITFVAGSR
ncbi:hypothetical protein A3709_10990 [Halioglobus sp. HI00S01]|uniref:MBL fold metallo-hydrolase n=1 Tax=Halioglobus sp. HI00S01 TaxID=1822214 RepID=UPI0007C36064|nr:MBL fold metallo-hydrolase [Halioglobus sp. HI00S01]KZX51335.1 hypothetical protein A3709_10990 [Halioglobus sp. HI00S01]